MSLSNEERQTLVALELKKARETFEEILWDCKLIIDPNEHLPRATLFGMTVNRHLSIAPAKTVKLSL